MKPGSIISGIFLLFFNSVIFSQEKMTVEEYIDLYKGIAILEMEQYHIPASITLAQGILESENGNSNLAREANNHFGIKCHKEWTGKTFYQDDDEKNECFRKYREAIESYRDHSDFLSSRERYKFLFDLDETDYKGWAYGLKQAGYATNPRYPELLIKIIEENGLDKYDKAAGQQQTEITQHSKPKTQHSAPNTQHSNSAPAEFEIAGRGGNDRVIFLNNGARFVLAREGDDVYLIAGEFDLYTGQIYLYNDMSKDDLLLPGQKVYLEKKKRRGGTGSHIVRPGEDLQSVSQDYGIRLKSLCRLNHKKAHGKLKEGEVLKLR